MSESDGDGASRAAAIEALVAEAGSLAEQERWEEVRTMLADAVEEHGDDPLLLTWAGLAAQRLGEEGEAYERFRRALALEPADPFVLAAAGSGVAELDDADAEPALRLAALTAPDFPFARAAYGAYLAREGMYEQAIVELGAARTLAPDEADHAVELGMAHLLAGHQEDGIASLEEALALTPDDAWLRALLGVVLATGTRGEEGAELLHRAAEERPEDVEVQLAAALAMAGEGWADPAWDAVARAEAWAQGTDALVIAEVEDRLDTGPEAAAAFLRDDFGPSLLRERLRQRG
jgi:Flp pilus assembly protein TadD